MYGLVASQCWLSLRALALVIANSGLKCRVGIAGGSLRHTVRPKVFENVSLSRIAGRCNINFDRHFLDDIFFRWAR
jgi:hypothetical protein